MWEGCGFVRELTKLELKIENVKLTSEKNFRPILCKQSLLSNF